MKSFWVIAFLVIILFTITEAKGCVKSNKANSNSQYNYYSGSGYNGNQISDDCIDEDVE